MEDLPKKKKKKGDEAFLEEKTAITSGQDQVPVWRRKRCGTWAKGEYGKEHSPRGDRTKGQKGEKR